MSFDYKNLNDFDLPAAADHSAHQYTFMKVDSSGNAAICGRGDLACGVLQNAPAASGRPAQIRPGGITKIKLGGDVTAGQAGVSDANGAAVNAASGDNAYMGIFLQSGASGDIVAFLIQPRGLS